MKKLENWKEKLKQHSGEMIVAAVILILCIGLFSVTFSMWKKTEEPTELSHEHSYIVDNTVKPTCTDKGYSIYLCECGDTYKADYTDALGHDWGEWTVTKQPSKTEEGIEKRVCKRNDAEEERSIAKLEPQTQPKHEHLYSKNKTIKPTCTNKGYSIYLCKCGNTYKADYTDALGHDWGEWTVTKQPTEDTEGTETRTCERCGITEERSIAKLPHSHSHAVDNVVKPTCTEKGYTVYVCSCGDTYKADYTDALGHDWGEWEVTKQPTATEEGAEKRTCSRGDAEEERSIPKLPNTSDFIDTWTNGSYILLVENFGMGKLLIPIDGVPVNELMEQEMFNWELDENGDIVFDVSWVAGGSPGFPIFQSILKGKTGVISADGNRIVVGDMTFIRLSSIN